MATKRGEAGDMEPTKGTGKSTAKSPGAGAGGRSTRAAPGPDGQTSEGAAAGAGTSGRGSAARSTSTTRRSSAKADTGAAKNARGAGAGTRRAAGAGKPDLKKDLRDFASSRPEGWSHDDWLQFLEHLQSRGHNIGDRDAIGSMLERERLTLALERIPGVGPQRVRSIADRYGYLWRLRETDADQLSREAGIPKAVAEKVLGGLRG